jgi:hypothetical protein
MIAASGKKAEASTILRAFGTFCFTVTVERHPERDRGHRAGDERGHRLGHALVDELHVLGRVELGRAQRAVEEDVRGGAGGGGDLLALQVGDRLDRVVAHPELRGRVLDVVEQEHLALAARREVGDDGAGRQHVEAAADHRLEQLEAGGELDQLEVEAALGPRARLLAEPDLAVDRRRVQVADAQLGARLRHGGGGEAAERGRAGGLEKGSAA